MSRLYGPNHRALQDRFDMRRLADGVERRIVRTEISEEHRRFIETRDMFWLATVDHEGRPTVSYKGGAPGFVRVLDPTTIAFPSYDGNGMFYSMGNKCVDDVQDELAMKDQMRAQREGRIVSRIEYEKYTTGAAEPSGD
jgi:predicted pyridoxine 5'-phosphate oxidase superfamily flavin-nucleotide-binding protein